jgi:hypothetical protein
MYEIANGDKPLKRGRGRPRVYELNVNVRFTGQERDALDAKIARTMAGATRQQAIREAVREWLQVIPAPVYNFEPDNCQADAEVAFAAAAKSEREHFDDAQRDLQAIEGALPSDRSTSDTIRAILDGAHARNPLRR